MTIFIDFFTISPSGPASFAAGAPPHCRNCQHFYCNFNAKIENQHKLFQFLFYRFHHHSLSSSLLLLLLLLQLFCCWNFFYSFCIVCIRFRFCRSYSFSLRPSSILIVVVFTVFHWKNNSLNRTDEICSSSGKTLEKLFRNETLNLLTFYHRLSPLPLSLFSSATKFGKAVFAWKILRPTNRNCVCLCVCRCLYLYLCVFVFYCENYFLTLTAKENAVLN